MQFRLLANASVSLQTQLQWLWHSGKTGSFITGDEQRAFALTTSNPGAIAPLQPARPPGNVAPQHPCNLPISDSLYEEFAAQDWHGFQFLQAAAYDRAVDDQGKPVGDLLRTLVFGPNYGHYVKHPTSGMILGLNSGSIRLLKQQADGFKFLDQTKTRGRATLACAAHPSESLMAYGDNSGVFHAHRFNESSFGKAGKIADKQRKASRLDFMDGGKTLLVGGMGYLASFTYSGGKFTAAHEIAISVRDFICVDDGRLLFVNQGLHGVSVYRYGEAGFDKLGELQPDQAVQQVAVSSCRQYLGLSFQESPGVNIYAVSSQ
jgi:hypothetical protein